MIRVTQALAIAGCTDLSWVTEEGLWRGSAVAKMAELRLKGTLNRDTVPKELRGYLDAIDKFLRETAFLPTLVEQKVSFKPIKRIVQCTGRLDAAGYMRGKPTVLDWKTGHINPAVALQLALYGHMLDPSRWWSRIAVQLKPDGEYSLYDPKKLALASWHSDVATALAALRIAQWKIKQGLAK